MITALSRHTWLLLTLRHQMTGLPRESHGLFWFVALLSVVMAWLRWGTPQHAIGMLIMLASMAMISPRWAAAYALISVGIDAVAIPVGGGYFFAGWELVATGAASIRCALGTRR